VQKHPFIRGKNFQGPEGREGARRGGKKGKGNPGFKSDKRELEKGKKPVPLGRVHVFKRGGDQGWGRKGFEEGRKVKNKFKETDRVGIKRKICRRIFQNHLS